MIAKPIVAASIALLFPLTAVAGPPDLPPIVAAPPTAAEAPPADIVAPPESDVAAAPDAGPPTQAAGAPVAEPEPAAATPPPPPPPPPPVATRAQRGDPVASHKVADPFADEAEDADERSPSIIRPIPRWKRIGLGVSAGVAVATLIPAIGLTISLARSNRDQGIFARNVFEAAERTRNTPYALQPNQGVTGLCHEAWQTPMGSGGGVYNAEVAQECRKGSFAASFANGLWVTAGFAVVSTAVFTGLLFAKDRRKSARSPLQRRQVRLGGGIQRGGANVTASGHF